MESIVGSVSSMGKEPMSAVIHPDAVIPQASRLRRMAEHQQPSILADVYRADTNIVIWRRNLSSQVLHSATQLLQIHPKFQAALVVSPTDAFSRLKELFHNVESSTALNENIMELVEMFCCLFELKKAGLRLTALDNAMCPRFHVDKVPCRMVTTYKGAGTEWLPQHAVDRSKLGASKQGLSDQQSGLFHSAEDINQLHCGDVALLKGELWEGNENAGLVHRSPAVSQGESRLLLTLDFVS